MKKIIYLLAASVLLFIAGSCAQKPGEISIVPMPNDSTVNEGSFKVAGAKVYAAQFVVDVGEVCTAMDMVTYLFVGGVRTIRVDLAGEPEGAGMGLLACVRPVDFGRFGNGRFQRMDLDIVVGAACGKKAGQRKCDE